MQFANKIDRKKLSQDIKQTQDDQGIIDQISQGLSPQQRATTPPSRLQNLKAIMLAYKNDAKQKRLRHKSKSSRDILVGRRWALSTVKQGQKLHKTEKRQSPGDVLGNATLHLLSLAAMEDDAANMEPAVTKSTRLRRFKQSISRLTQRMFKREKSSERSLSTSKLKRWRSQRSNDIDKHSIR